MTIEELKQALEAATPGPLFTAWSEVCETLEITCDARKGMVGIAQIETGFKEGFDAKQKANARLIVAAVNNLPKLLKVAEAAKDLPYLYDQASADPYNVGYSQVSDEIELLRKALKELGYD